GGGGGSEEGGAGGRHRRGKCFHRPPEASVRDQRSAGQREQLPFARRDRRAEKADPQREVLDDGTRAGDADAEHAADQNLDERQEHHRQQRERGEGVFDERREPHFGAAAPLRWRNASRSLRAMSNTSGGTICPRIALARISPCAVHSAPSALVTFSPWLDISSTARLSCFGTSARSLASTATAISVSCARSAAEIASHVFLLMTVAPTIGVRPMSSM